MESSGAEKKIQASFHELRLEDERVTPRFATVWNRAQFKSAGRQTAVDFRIAAAVTIGCLALFSLVLLTRPWQRTSQSNYPIANGVVHPSPSPALIIKEHELVQQDGSAPVVSKPRLVRFARRSQTAKFTPRQAIKGDVLALSRWQSPTTGLLRSPGDEVLRELPQLNQALHEMESFLPSRTN